MSWSGAAGATAWQPCVSALGRALPRLSRGCRRLRDLPQLHRLIIASGSDARPIGRPGCRDYISSMAPVGQDKPAAARIPHLDEIVPASRGDARPIGRPGQGIHFICMTAKYQVIIALTLLKSIPDLYSPVPGSGGNTFTIRRPGY